MKKTLAEKTQIVRADHCNDISFAVTLLSLLSENFFSGSTANLNKATKRDLGEHLVDFYDQISNLLTIAICILANYERDLDAAQGIESDAVKIHKEYLKAVYGLTEDTDPAGEHPAKERTSDHEGY